MNNKFVALFQEFGYTVEQVGEDSFIADNGIFCIPYIEHDLNGRPEIYAITIDSCHKEELKEIFKGEEHIGKAAWWRGVPFKIYTNYIYGNDYMLYEVKGSLESMAKHGYEK